MTRYGGPDVLELGEVPEPTAGPRDVVIDVHAAGLNPLDFKIRLGKLRMITNYRLPLVLGNEVAGVVRSVGAEVRGFAPGDRVFARLEKDRMGGLAERVAADVSVVARMPVNLDFPEAAGLPLAGLTALQALRESAALRHGQRVLIHAGSGGVGSLAIQIAKRLGLWVATTTSGRNAAFVRELGADQVVDYTAADVTEVVRELDAVFDTLGNATEMEALKMLRPGGVTVGISSMPDDPTARRLGVAAPVRLLLALMTTRRRRAYARAGRRYVYLFMRPDGAQLAELAAWVESGALRPIVHKIYPLEEARLAFEELERGRARGKIVVRLRP